METENLHTASVYINNLLLARGLLRNGKAIDFARPENGAGGADATMAKIINLVHDLVLRRDREAEQRESLATTVRTLRGTESRQTIELDKLQTEKTELSRSLALAEGQERAFKTNLRSAEATVRGLKEQMQRMRSSILQIRAQCANDIRKRDIEMHKLKSHLTERQRGKREGMGITTIKITPPPKPGTISRAAEGGEGLDSPGYSLKEETTEFLTQLCQNLSDENDALIGLARSTVHTLKELQGLQNSAAEAEDDKLDTESHSTLEHSTLGKSGATIPPTPYEAISSDMEAVLDSLRLILTNPSFVPLEEVEVRDEEIFRLREGWEKMEGRWKEAVSMMDGWHRRMAGGGDSVNVDELRTGMELGLGDGRAEAHRDEVEGLSSEESSISDDDNAEQQPEDEESASNHELKDTNSRDTSSAHVPERQRKCRSRALGERSGNSRPPISPRKVSFANDVVNHSHLDDNDDDDDDDEIMLVDGPSVDKEKQSQNESKRKAESKIPRHIPRPGPKMTVNEKLAAVESEANAAEERRRKEETRKRPRDQTNGSVRVGRRGRRKSTLSPEELNELIGVSNRS